MGQGPPALALTLSLSEPSDPPILVIEGSPGATVTSAQGRVSIRALPTGGDGSYSYSWANSEQSDQGDISVSSVGTTNQQTYDTLQFESVVDAGGAPLESAYAIGCTVTDGTGANISVFTTLDIMTVPG